MLSFNEFNDKFVIIEDEELILTKEQYSEVEEEDQSLFEWDVLSERFKYVVRGKKKVKKTLYTKAQKNKRMGVAKRKKVARKGARARKKNVGGQVKALRKRKKSMKKRKAFGMRTAKPGKAINLK